LLGEYQVFVYEKCYLSLSALEYSVFSNLYMNPYARPTLIYSQQKVGQPRRNWR